MKFVSASSKFRVTVPGHEDHYTFHGPGGVHRQKVQGLHAQFERNTFDSEAAQKKNRWSDEDRELVEQALLEHELMGTRLLRELVEQDVAGITTLADVPTCLFRVTIDGEVEECGRPALAGNDHCVKHAAMAEAPEAKPNRSKVSA